MEIPSSLQDKLQDASARSSSGFYTWVQGLLHALEIILEKGSAVTSHLQKHSHFFYSENTL